MALHFIFGGAGSGKTHFAMSEVIRDSMAHPERHYLYIVPEQATMEAQRALVRLHPRHAILNIEALSITRLAFRVFAETGFREESLLEEIGKTFLLEKVALEEKSHLRWYGSTITRPEYLSEMKAMISEFLLYGVKREELEKAGAKADLKEDDPLALKMKDLALIEEAFEKKLAGSYMTQEEIPEKLAALAGRSRLVRGSVIVMDGFTGFTPLQEELIGKLMPLSSEFYVTVTMDPARNPFMNFGKNDLFGLSSRTAKTLLSIAEREHVPHPSPVFIEQGEKSRHARSPELSRLERRLFRSGRRTKPEVTREVTQEVTQEVTREVTQEVTQEATHETARQPDPAVSVFAAGTPRLEVEHTARMITRLVRTEGMRYRDIAVISGDLSVYGNYIRQIFPEYGIPCFVDQKKSLLENPFLEYLRASLEVMSEDWSYDSMFRMLKSGMTDLDMDEIDRLENYVRGTGVRGKRRWHEPFTRHYRYEDPGEVPQLDALRARVCGLLDPLAETFSKRRSTVREKTDAVRDFCARSGAEAKMEAKRAFWEERGRSDLASEYEQVYPYVTDFLDKLVAVLGDEKISMRDYRALVEAGFAEARIGFIPSANDQVLAGDMERTRLPEVKALFFIGVNEGLVPKTPVSGGVLTETDRRTLEEAGLRLKPGAREQMHIDRFYMYLTLSRPSERMYLSWSACDAAGNVMRPSYLIDTVRRIFPGLETSTETQDLKDLVEREETGMKLLTEGLEEIENRGPSGAFLELFSWYFHDRRWHGRAAGLLRAAGTRKRDDRISEATAEALYGKILRNSASRLELFYSCEYAHFLAYGLKLKERAEYGFTGLDMGTIVHGALEHFAEESRRDGGSWADLADPDAEERRTSLTEESLLEAVRGSGADVLFDTARDHYQIVRMERLLATTTWAQAVLLAAGDFRPAGAEQAFRDLTDLEGSEIELAGGGKMLLTGRIDRVDTCEADGNTYVRIVDYKTGNVTFDLNEVYHGLELQLIVYLDAAMAALRKEGKNPVPAQILYYNVQDPVVDFVEGEDAEETRERILKKLQGSGYVSSDPEALSHLDHELAVTGKSKVIPVSFKKDGSPGSASKALDPGRIMLLIFHTRKMIRDAGVRIMAGRVRINPYELGTKTACDYCPYRAACRFDRRIPGCTYRKLLPMKTDEIFEKLEEEEDGDGHGMDGRTEKGH